MTEYDEMLDAHVRFEVDRLTGEGLEESVRTEVEALFGWLDQVTLDDLVSAGQVTDPTRRTKRRRRRTARKPADAATQTGPQPPNWRRHPTSRRARACSRSGARPSDRRST